MPVSNNTPATININVGTNLNVHSVIHNNSYLEWIHMINLRMTTVVYNLYYVQFLVIIKCRLMVTYMHGPETTTHI